MGKNLILKSKRVAVGLSQQDVSERLGITLTAYSLIETGKRMGKLETWIKIQNLFQIPDSEMWNIIKHNINE